MSWSNVKLILGREVRDQLRDRRTLFMIAVLPLLLYPLLGMSFVQVRQFMQERPTRILVIGDEKLRDDASLFETNEQGEAIFHHELFDATNPKPGKSKEQQQFEKARLLQVTFDTPSEDEKAITPRQRLEHQQKEAERRAKSSDYEVVVLFPPNFAENLAERREKLLTGSGMSEADAGGINPQIYRNSSREKSIIAYRRVDRTLSRWMNKIGEKVLEEHKIPISATRPFDVETVDVAAEGHENTPLWSKLLPFVLLIWALTGAFYPAVDLCAGEKERGTLETLLSSPAERSEIVVGKLLTIMLFSVATAVLNLVSLSMTGMLILSQINEIGPPPWAAMLWLLVALVPVSALFSAVCLALAALARSTKEGQYYLMPVMLITMPLVMMPMSPGVELTLGNSLVPIMGIVLLLRTTLEGDYITAARYVVPAMGVTLVCCLFAIRWAIDQFNKESVLFRESERFDLGLWTRQLFRDREPTPTVAAAFLCGLLILMLKFLLAPMVQADITGSPESALHSFTIATIVTLVAFILTPALLMTVMLTRSPRKTLLLNAPKAFTIPAAILLATFLHPILIVMKEAVEKLYPLNPDLVAQFTQLESVFNGASFWHLLLLIAVLPAICEELAFRGFILSGLRHLGHRRMAIIISAAFFGVAHGILQQSLIATFSGVVMGYIAVRTASILPCIFYHATNNALALTLGRFIDSPPFTILGARIDETRYVYHTPTVIVAGIFAILLLMYFRTLEWEPSAEEALQEALDNESTSDEAPELEPPASSLATSRDP